MNKKGFSLIELIVALAVLGIAISVTSYGLSYIQSTRTKDCAERINAGIERARMNAMSRTGANTVEFYKTDDGVFMVETIRGVAQTAEKIGAATLTVKYTVGSGASRVEYTLGNTPHLVLEFNKSSGAFKGTPPKKITISGGGRDRTITLYSLTGKSVLE